MQIPGTYLKASEDQNERIAYIIDYLLNPAIESFRQIMINYESGTFIGNNKFRFTYQNWNEYFEPEIFLNNGSSILNNNHYEIDKLNGVIKVDFDAAENDSLMATYNFDYFPERILKGFILRTIGIINTAGQGSATSYSITDAPTNWDGVISDLVVAMCMEKLLLDYDLWKGRLIFAMGTDQMLDGYGGDAARQLETIKRNCEERAYKTIDNTQFKAPFTVAAPTKYYYRSLMLGSGPRVSPHGYGDYGKMRGIVINKNVGTGFTGPSY
jgi:hypothetical protein